MGLISRVSSRTYSRMSGKWTKLDFQTEVQPKKLTIAEMGQLERQRLEVERKRELEANPEPTVYQKMTEDKIHKLIVDYNSDISDHSEDEDRSRFHKKKRRRATDPQM